MKNLSKLLTSIEGSALKNMACCPPTSNVTNALKNLSISTSTASAGVLKKNMPSIGSTNPFNAKGASKLFGPVDMSTLRSPSSAKPTTPMIEKLLETPLPVKAMSSFPSKVMAEIKSIVTPKSATPKNIFTYGNLMGMPSKTSGAAQTLSYSSVGPGAADLGFISGGSKSFVVSPIPAGKSLSSFESVNNLHRNVSQTGQSLFKNNRSKMNFSASTIGQSLGNSNRLT